MNRDTFICRVCLLSDSNIYPLQATTELKNEYTFLEMFNACTNLEALEIDDLPQFICQPCSNDLQISFDFLMKASTSDQFLKAQYASQHDSKHDVCEEDCSEKVGQPANVIVNDLSLEHEDQDRDMLDPIDPIKEEFKQEYSLELNHGFEKEFVHFAVTEYASDLESDGDSFNISEIDIKETDGERAAVIQISSKKNAAPTPQNVSNESVECPHCGKVLKPMSLVPHLKRCRKEEKIYLCSSCPKSFAVRSDLKNHMRTHDKKRPRRHICSDCGKGFFEKQSLQVHMIRHQGIKEFHCKFCPKNFTTKQSLITHEFTHNREVGKLSCKFCSKKFSLKCDLKVHERFHTGDFPYQCEFCNKSFAVKSHYNYHLGKHTGVTYKCDQCDKEFLNRASLWGHKFKHSGQMPHECPVCKKGFVSRYKLNRHLRIHKPQEGDADEYEIMLEEN